MAVVGICRSIGGGLRGRSTFEMDGPPAAAATAARGTSGAAAIDPVALPSTTPSSAAMVARSRELLSTVLGPTHPLLCFSPSGGHAGLGRLLAPLPFGYLRAVVVEVARATGFSTALLTEAALACSSSDKAGRIRFLVRLVACVALVDPRAYGHLLVTVVPSRLLVGADPAAAHALLQCLVQASGSGATACTAAAEEVARLGDVALCERSIRLRAGIKRLQRRVRARLSRKESKADSAAISTPAEPVSSTIPTTDEPAPISLKSLPMRITTRRPRRSDDEPLVLCLSSTAAAHSPLLAPCRAFSQADSGCPPAAEDGDGGADRSGAVGSREEEGPDLQQLIQRSWRARRRAEQQAEALAQAKRLMEADLKGAHEARARLEETLQRTLASKRRAEEELRKARARSTAMPVVGADAAAVAAVSGAQQDLDEQEQQQKQHQSTLELELKQATTLIADLRKRLRQRQEAERQQLEQWQEKLQEREARVQRLAEALQRRQRQVQGVRTRPRRGLSPVSPCVRADGWTVVGLLSLNQS